MKFKVMEEVGCVQMKDLEHGQVAVVMEGELIGRAVVMCDNDYCQILGEDDGWSNAKFVRLNVRLLKPGEIIKVEV